MAKLAVDAAVDEAVLAFREAVPAAEEPTVVVQKVAAADEEAAADWEEEAAVVEEQVGAADEEEDAAVVEEEVEAADEEAAADEEEEDAAVVEEEVVPGISPVGTHIPPSLALLLSHISSCQHVHPANQQRSHLCARGSAVSHLVIFCCKTQQA